MTGGDEVKETIFEKIEGIVTTKDGIKILGAGGELFTDEDVLNVYKPVPIKLFPRRKNKRKSTTETEATSTLE